MNRVIREKYGDRIWAVVVDRFIKEEWKYANGQVYLTRQYFTNERMYLTRQGLQSEFAGADDLYKSEGEADSVAMLLVLAHPEYMGHIEVVKVQ